MKEPSIISLIGIERYDKLRENLERDAELRSRTRIKHAVAAERERIRRGVEGLIEEYRCPVHQTKNPDGSWKVTPPNHKFCHEGWIAPRGDVALQAALNIIEGKSE